MNFIEFPTVTGCRHAPTQILLSALPNLACWGFCASGVSISCPTDVWSTACFFSHFGRTSFTLTTSFDVFLQIFSLLMTLYFVILLLGPVMIVSNRFKIASSWRTFHADMQLPQKTFGFRNLSSRAVWVVWLAQGEVKNSKRMPRLQQIYIYIYTAIMKKTNKH